ncbi:MAG: PatB family C-S lyase [Proteobacteria bacterium]|nr:PatB family C-S lyase [Pseudomonadota bacterium]HQR04965.1 PatB family C-S lyase [Rhodocyclaceae bacterium]
MAFDFAAPPDRRGGDSTKWNRYQGRDVLPMWVADMDFRAPPAVLAALHRRVDHGVFGYGGPSPSLQDTVRQHLQAEYGWAVEPQWIVWLPGLVAGLNVACRAIGEDGDNVFTAIPVYPPFLGAPEHSRRRLCSAPLVRTQERWQWDFGAVDTMLTERRPRLWLFCHPHNPVGRAWDEEELERIADLALRHDLVIASDEIHCGLVLDPARRHRPLASLAPEIARRTITLMAPSKTFNIPGLYCSFAIISDPDLRRRFQHAMAGIMPHVNTLGLVACEAALRDGGEWHAALLDHLRGNARRVHEIIRTLPGLAMTPVEATYLAWIDCAGLATANPQRFFEQAGVGLSAGGDFGPGGERFVRLNFGCSRVLLEEALARMSHAVSEAQ